MGADRATRIVMSHRLLRRYVLPGERVVLAMRRHWAKLLEPALTCLAVFVLVAWATLALQPALGDRALWLWWLWLAALARLGWRVLLWRVEWFVATDKRMLLLTGLVTHQIGMMPLLKVTDMRYSRSVLGQLLGYGQFLLESAGQDQALRSIDWVAHPDATYRDLCALIFTPTGTPDTVAAAHARLVPGVAAPPAPLRPAAPTAPPSVPPPRPAPSWPPVPGAGTGGDLDTQPIPAGAPSPVPVPVPVPTFAEARVAPLAVEAEAIAGEEALRRAEEDAEDRSWDVSEPTATFVRLGRRGDTAPRAHDDAHDDADDDPHHGGHDDPQAPGADPATRPTGGKPDGADGRPT
ncbi:PH domain-containing protein [Cellulomonas sp. NPDC057328]|uniref:PH domain-containing protein n=1 Tax=Cellulomonas sp. NPDC057328 TaxID=3346101 RepID=UPI003642DA51